MPPPRPAAAPDTAAPADAEATIGRPREASVAATRWPKPEVVVVASERATGGAGPRQEAAATDQAAAPAAKRVLDPVTIVLIIIAGAAAATAILNHAILRAKAARPRPARAKGARAGRIASLASEKPPRALTARRPDGRAFGSAAPVDPPGMYDGLHEIVRTMKHRAA